MKKWRKGKKKKTHELAAIAPIEAAWGRVGVKAAVIKRERGRKREREREN